MCPSCPPIGRVLAWVFLASCVRGTAGTDGAALDARDGSACAPGCHVPDGMDAAGCSPGVPDLPDPAGIDSNCDGIDGDLALAIFVAEDGDDANPGTPDAPLRSLRAALARAVDRSRTQVLVAAGAYTETSTLQLPDGVGISGGYDRAAHWQRGAGQTRVRGASIAVEAVGLTHATVLARIEFVAADAMGPGLASVALRAVDSPALVVEDHATLSAGRGLAGANGSAGALGADGRPGARGSDGAADNQTLPGAGGAGGANAECPGTSGASGGRGGWSPEFLGQDGRSSAAGVPGGHGGSMPGCTGVAGSPGQTATSDGARGPSGHGGSPAGQFQVISFAYLPADGTGGEPGQAGAGGGGGGGSSGQNGVGCVDGAGNGGGGGGAGGCGGAGGRPGGGGGASVAVLAIRSGFTMRDCTLVTLGGGAGGAGGTGGTGGTGGVGGLGASVAINELGEGGAGGAGRRGGEGGAGGGGGGGPSVGIWADTVSVQTSRVIYQLGDPGRGGSSPGGAPAEGQRGIQAQTGP